ncbi:MAG: hypothetical protein GY841_24060, partial [FCB group bacterium]|nr:hypothetical protein [FCB group bacterium]
MGKRLKRILVYRATVSFIRIINLLPRRLVLFFGEMFGLFAGTCLCRESCKALVNLNRAFGKTLSYRQKKRIIRHSWITFGRSFIEMMRLRKYFYSQIADDIEVVGEEHFRKAYDRGRGVVVFSGHIGNFELLPAWVAQSGYKTTVIGRELFDKRLDHLMVSNREALGIINIRSDDSPRTALRYLKDGYGVGILIDTDSFRVAGELTPFFGRPAKTPTGPAQLGLLAGAAFLPMFCLSFPGGKYKIIIGPELIPESTDRSRESVYQLTCRMT